MNRESTQSLILFCGLAVTALSVPAAAQETLGRLFFTPAQRASLDVARSQRARTTLATENTEEQQAAPTSQTITYGGMVRRSDGKSTVWINNRPVNENEPTIGSTVVGRVRADGSVSLQVPQSGRSVELKPGQSVELLSGAIEEGYARKPVPTESKPAAKSGTAQSNPVPKTAPQERSTGERDRENREHRREEAARASQNADGAKPGTASSSPGAGPAR